MTWPDHSAEELVHHLEYERTMRAIVLVIGMLCAGHSAGAADMETRDVVSRIFAATAQTPADLSGKNLANLDLAGLDFKHANLKGASLFGADLTGADLAGCDLEGANLDRATLTNTDLSNANLRGASIRRPSIYTSMTPDAAEAPIFRGADLERAWLEGVFDYSDFTGANLTDARFGALNPQDSQGIIRGPILRGAKFVEANLKGAVLERADLSFADFSGAQLDGANLQNADLTRTVFRDASLRDVNLSSAHSDGTDWTNAVVR